MNDSEGRDQVAALDQGARRCDLLDMTPIERAARALCKLDGHAEDDEREGKSLWRSYLPQAQAVVEAIHEPSFRMTEAGAAVIRYVGPEESQSGYQGDAANVWRFMIDAMREDISPKL